MTWLIIYSSKNQDKCAELKAFFKRNKISVKVAEMEKDADFLPSDVPAKLKLYSHCVFLCDKAPAKNEAFAWGVALGRGLMAFAIKSEWTKQIQKCGSLSDFESFDRLLAYLENNIHALALEAKKKEAWKKLFDTGNPFTGDSLSVHVQKDNREIVQTYIDAGMSLNERTSTGVPMLNVAIRSEQVEEVKWMLEQDVDLNAVSNDRGYSALMDCVWKKNLEIAKVLVSKGVNFDFVSSDNQSALTLAVGAGNAELVKILSDAGASPDKFDALGMSAWTYAKLFKRQDLLDLMEKNHHGQ